MTRTGWAAMAQRLIDGLGLTSAPIAITFIASAPPGVVSDYAVADARRFS